MQKLTQRQKAVLDFIVESITDRGYPPTLREIGNHLGIKSTNGVNDHLRALERKGYLTREDMKSRTLRPTPEFLRDAQMDVANDAEMIEIPIVGRVAAGLPLEAIEQPEDTVRIDRMLVGARGEIFGLRVTGDSMIEAGIHDGDYVFVKKQIEAPRGSIVICMVGDEATCKYFYPEKQHIRLEPANASMAPILIPRTDWRETAILGVVVGVYRKL
ncbi:MAG TPA: transcriptional repressor LexA [Sandaracinaceae bacterium LLY-WYZ-13_1]|nr:transcriptional repressor LexA [Sandaracinaceae bacterium LLY-WYZ-13_1]